MPGLCVYVVTNRLIGASDAMATVHQALNRPALMLVLCPRAPNMACAENSIQGPCIRLVLVVWNPLLLDPSDGVFGRFDLASLCGCHTINVCLFV